MGERKFPDPIFDDAFAAKYGLPPGTQITGPPISGTLLSKLPDGRQGNLLKYNGPWPPPKEQQESVSESHPRPAAPSPPPPEVIRDNHKALAIGLAPDVCRAPEKPCPFPVWGTADNNTNYSPDVFASGQAIKHQQSKFFRCFGDEAGVGLGCKSNTIGDVVEPVTSSSILNVNGIPVQRHADRCTMNNGNTEGEYCFVEATGTDAAPDATDEDDRTQLGKGWDGFYENSGEAQMVGDALSRLGDYASDISLIGDDIKSGVDALPSLDETIEFGSNVVDGVSHKAQEIWNDPSGAAQDTWEWGKETLGDLWGGVTDAYDKGGIVQAGGHLAAAGISAVNPFKKLKMAGEVAEEVGDIGKAAQRGQHDRHEGEDRDDNQTEKNASENNGENNSGEKGGRFTGKLQVECFDVPDNLKDKTDEYKRQLDEQMNYINTKMTADDMAYAHWVLEKAGGTAALRRSHLQQKHRNLYKEYLASQGKSAEEIKSAVEGKAATHFLDMVAGGNPAIFSTDAKGNPVLGDSEINSYIGNQWTQKGRADSLKQEADRMRKSGRSGDLMSVDLRHC